MSEIEYNGRVFTTYTDADVVLDILESYEAGEATQAELADRHGVSRETVRRYCTLAGITKSRSETLKLRWDREMGTSPAIRNRARTLYLERVMPPAVIADVLDVNESAVKRWVAPVARTPSEARSAVFHDPRHPVARERIALIAAVCRSIIVDGLTYAETMDRHGIGYSTISTYLRSDHNPYATKRAA